MLNKKDLKELKNIIQELKRHKKVMAIILFGSHVKDTIKPLSDIDIAVITKNADKKLEAEIHSFSSHYFDVVNFHKLPLYIQFEVFKYGKPLFIRNKTYLSQLKRIVLREYLEMSFLYERMTKNILK